MPLPAKTPLVNTPAEEGAFPSPGTPMLEGSGRATIVPAEMPPTANGSSGGGKGSKSSRSRSSAIKALGSRGENPSAVTPVRATSSSNKWRHRKSMLLFERASPRWWNPQFQSSLLESQYWKCSFPQLRDRFRIGLVYIVFTGVAWFVYHAVQSEWRNIFPYQLACLAIIGIALGILGFTFSVHLYQRFYLPTSFFCTFLICLLSLVLFSLQKLPLISPVGTFATSLEVVLLLYTVIPLPLYLCILASVTYSILFEVLSHHSGFTNGFSEFQIVKLILHVCIHVLGIHIFILYQVRQRKTFLKVGQSLMARNDLGVEKQFKDNMIQSVMPKSVANELLKDQTELRRPSMGPDVNKKVKGRGSGDTHGSGSGPAESGPGTPRAGSQVVIAGPLPQFRPFQMNLMTNVSILFADIAGFTKMSSNKSAEELVWLLNDLFGRFDDLCTALGCEKISTLGDCYYCVSGCPTPRPDHASCCVEMGLAMIKAIKQFDEQYDQEVNMRVGIHTGTVMCGIVGTKRFKFDVFSNDVTLANDMESSGMSGRVHVSQTTAGFLTDLYDLQQSEDYLGPGNVKLKTYFIAGRKGDGSDTETENSVYNRDSDHLEPEEPDVETKTGSGFFNKLSKRGPSSGSSGKGAGGSLRMKLLAGKSSPSASYGDARDAKKSASLQGLSSSPLVATPLGPHKSLPVEKTGSGKNLNKDLANGSSGSRSLNSLQERASRSSGFMDEHGGRGVDSVAAHAASMTRFETDHRDFDRRLADVIQGSDLALGGYWIYTTMLNPWTLRFRDPSVESEYRHHFAAGLPAPVTANSHIPSYGSTDETGVSGRYGAPKYSVVIDIGVATVVHLIVSITTFAVFGVGLWWFIYFALSSVFALGVLLGVGIPLWREKKLISCITYWSLRHIVGLLLVALPVGAALCNLQYRPDLERSVTRNQLVCAYIIFVCLFCHTNFSQLSSWPKTVMAYLIGAILILLSQYCLTPDELCMKSDVQVHNNSFDDFSIPPFSLHYLYRWEVVVDVILALILITFLNYQIESGFRMSFYGDVQSRRDTERMQAMRDQADWLLTNIIPNHVVEELKTSSKYSENHDEVAVLFASITNWGDMYEETFEGGREFLRVLNEVIGDFDELLERPEHSQVEKIKTIGSTYMASTGLNSERRRTSAHPYEHLYQLMDFAMEMQETLENFNSNLLNFELILKLGYNIGPITAGVIGTTKLYYDIWGDTVNIASRMYSTGVKHRIQVSQKVKEMLSDRYDFDFRDHIEVKGIDGGMDVYLVKGKKQPSPNALQPSLEGNTEL